MFLIYVLNAYYKHCIFIRFLFLFNFIFFLDCLHVTFHNFLTLLNIACFQLLPAAIPMHWGCFVVPGTLTGLWETLGHQSASGPTAVVGPHRHHFLPLLFRAFFHLATSSGKYSGITSLP